MDSLKTAFIIVSIIAVLLAVGLSYFFGREVNREEIHRAQLEMQQLRASRDSIKTVVALKDSMQSVLSERVEDLDSETDRLRREVQELEEERARNQLTVRNIRKKEDLQNRLAETFPEMAESDWGVTEVYNEEFDVGIEYLLVPLWFSETFIIDHQNSESYKQQVSRFVEIDSLHQQVSVLKDSLFVLEREKAEAFENGYNEAYSRYEDINEKYINLLEQPPSIELGIPKWGIIGASVGAGVLVGTQIN
jgi:predicted nucleotide-binding protein (sugar kinase/HSP70/actin superfamily)